MFFNVLDKRYIVFMKIKMTNTKERTAVLYSVKGSPFMKGTEDQLSRMLEEIELKKRKVAAPITKTPSWRDH